jgi:hypothetical protein
MPDQLSAQGTPLPAVNLPSRQLRLAVVFVFCVTLIAWVPMCSHYVPVADDSADGHLLDHGVWSFALSALRTSGAWRYLGLLIGSLAARHTSLYGPVVVLAHATVGVLYLLACCRLLGNLSVSLALTLLFAAFPMAAEAVSWAAASDLVVVETLFLLTVLLFCRFGFERRRQLPCLVASFALTLLAQLVQENLLFAFAAVGFIVWIPRNAPVARNIRTMAISRYAGFGPTLGALAFLVCYKLLPGTSPTKTVSIHLVSAISPLLRQYSMLCFLGPWRSATTRRLLFWGWQWWMIALAAVAGAGATLALALRSEAPATTPSDGSEAAAGSLPSPRLLGYLLALLFGATAIYAVAGGYSLDSRKRYPLLPLTLWIAGWVWLHVFPRKCTTAPAARWNTLPTLALAVVGVLSTWLYVDVWRYECRRQAAMTDFCLRHDISGVVRIDGASDVYQAWPQAASDWGFRLDGPWTPDPMLDGVGSKRLTSQRSGPPMVLRYDPQTDSWSISPSTDQ